MTSKLWGGRFEKSLSNISAELSESISYDVNLYEYDIEASRAHANMLATQGIITKDQNKNIQSGLDTVLDEFRENKIKLRPELEDIHTHVETRLGELIGEDAKRLHTGRSRNDQVAVDTHLFLRDRIKEQITLILELLSKFVELADKNQGKVWAGFTHLQIAQPVALSHYLMAYFFKFKRDFELLEFARQECNVSPLGACAMVGPNYNLDRFDTSKALKFSKPYENSVDAVSNRDYQLSYHFFATRLFIHISRFCEDIIIYNSAEFRYVQLGDAVTTGSSIMPQKKNPDICELLRGKSARITGNLISLLQNLKGLPLTYNRDLQEDKVFLFDTTDQVRQGLLGMVEVLNNIEFNSEAVIKNLQRGFAPATDIADYLVKEFLVPFREAHEIVGRLVLHCEESSITLDQLSSDTLKDIIGHEVPQKITQIESSIERKQGYGSTNSASVKEQLNIASEFLKSKLS